MPPAPAPPSAADAARAVLHVDLDAFFVAVERVLDPRLRGRPVVVGGPPEARGVVAAASYEARAFGIHSAMPMAQALRLCPDLVRVEGDHERYARASRAVFALIGAYAPVVEKVSVDEAYLDLTGTQLVHGRAVDAAERMRREIRDRLRLDVTVGVAHNRLVSKVASGFAKPRGLFDVQRNQAPRFFAPLPVQALPGVGPVTTARLRDFHIDLLGALARTESWFLERVFGVHGPAMQARARGEDDTPVCPPWERPQAKSIGHERTFARDEDDLRVLRARLQELLEEATARLRQEGLLARTLTVKVRYADFVTVSRDASLPQPSDHDLEWTPLAQDLLARMVTRRTLVRLVGVRLTGLTRGFWQANLFDPARAEQRRRLDVLDRLRAKYGERTLRAGERLRGGEEALAGLERKRARVAARCYNGRVRRKSACAARRDLALCGPTLRLRPGRSKTFRQRRHGVRAERTGNTMTHAFGQFGLDAELLRALDERGYASATPIQVLAIPPVLAGRDVLASAQTGTGKTAAFTLPILQRLQQAGPRPGRPVVRVLVLVPTRELAAQVADNVRHYGRHLPLRTAVIFGGVGMPAQVAELRRGVDVVVATPGRLIDHLEQGTVRLDAVETLVLDEADRMLDMGFIRPLRRIVAALPRQRQTLLFSATFSPEIRALASAFQSKPVEVAAARPNAAAASVTHVVHPVDKARKRMLLSRMIHAEQWPQVLVFTRTKHGANRLCEQLDRDGLRSVAIHGNKSQNARTRALADFKAGKVRVMVATDLAARGLDIVQLPLVVNYELPMAPEDYVHRVGRTGRAGLSGRAVSLMCAEERPLLADVERLLKQRLEQVVVPGFEPGAPLTPSERASAQESQRRSPARPQRPQRRPAPAARRRWR